DGAVRQPLLELGQEEVAVPRLGLLLGQRLLAELGREAVAERGAAPVRGDEEEGVHAVVPRGREAGRGPQRERLAKTGDRLRGPENEEAQARPREQGVA